MRVKSCHPKRSGPWWIGFGPASTPSAEASLAVGIRLSAEAGDTPGSLCPLPLDGEAPLPTRLADAIPLKCGIRCPSLEEEQIQVSG